MENGQGTGSKLGLPPLTPEQQEALQRVGQPKHTVSATLSIFCILANIPFYFFGKLHFYTINVLTHLLALAKPP